MRHSSGFTLVEVMVTVAIIGILAAVTIPSYLSWKPGYAYRGGISQVRGDVNRAKLRAFEIGREVRFQICGNGSNYQLIDGDSSMNSSWLVPGGAAVPACPMTDAQKAAFDGAGRSVFVKDFSDYPLVTITPAGTVEFTPRGITSSVANFNFSVEYDGQSPFKGNNGDFIISVAGRVGL